MNELVIALGIIVLVLAVCMLYMSCIITVLRIQNLKLSKDVERLNVIKTHNEEYISCLKDSAKVDKEIMRDMYESMKTRV